MTTAALAADGPAPNPAVKLILVMLDTLDDRAAAEVESALSSRLHSTPTPAERRVAELGYLARLLERANPSSSSPTTRTLAAAADASIGRGRRRQGDVRTPRLSQSIYDARQPTESPESPSAEQLVERYGSWVSACRAAFGLLPDGRSRGSGSAWAQPLAGKQRPRYDLDDVRANIRRCARELGRIPSAGDYHLWAREAKAKARAAGAGIGSASDHPRIPGISVVYRLFPKSGREANRWRAALADIGLTEAEIAEARTAHLIGVTAPPPSAKSRRAKTAKVEVLMLQQAIELARERGGSLDWLAGRTHARGMPPAAAATFSADRLRAARERRGVTDGALRAAARLQVGPWRRALAGQIELSFGQLIKLAAVLGLAVDELTGSEK